MTPDSLYDFLHPRGLRIVDVRIETETPRACVLCGQRIRSDGRDDPVVQALISDNEGIAVVCARCAVEVLR